ncbi:MAG: heme o synthase [Actinomycetota bacterium]
MPLGVRPLGPSRIFSHRSQSNRSAKGGFWAYVSLTKPRIVELLLVTTIPTMVLAERGWPSITLMVATVCGGALAAGGANAINMVIDRDIDALMERTRHRPLVTGALTPRRALIFASLLEIAAAAVLVWWANVLAAVLALSATAFYVVIYSLWLKRSSKQNIVIGGAAGAVPALVGWAAVTNSLAWAPVVLFAVIFLWTPPHFWALAIRHQDDYRAAGVPMLPVVTPIRETIASMVRYCVVLVAVSLILVPVADLGLIYGITALLFGVAFVIGTVRLGSDPSEAKSMRLFSFSITYVTVLFGAVMADVLILG